MKESKNSSTGDYILGVSREEYERLGLQHSLWKSRATRLWKRAGIPEHSSREFRMLDCGCGPGFTTFELANYIGPKGTIVGIDLAEKYLQLLETRYAAETKSGNRKLSRIETVCSPLDTFRLPNPSFDAAYARWIFIFLRDPETAIKNIATHLKPGGLFILQEYVDYTTMALHPETEVFKKFVRMVIRSWADQGSDAHVAGKLPEILARNGFEILGLKPQTRVGMPHQRIWQWPDSFFKNYLPVLEKEKYLTPSEVGEFEAVWSEASKNPSAFYVGPMVLDIIARKI